MARRKPGQLVHFEHEVLEALAGEPSGAMTVGEIQERTQVTTRSVVRILARLRAAGWVTVEWDADPLAPPAGGVRCRRDPRCADHWARAMPPSPQPQPTNQPRRTS